MTMTALAGRLMPMMRPPDVRFVLADTACAPLPAGEVSTTWSQLRTFLGSVSRQDDLLAESDTLARRAARAQQAMADFAHDVVEKRAEGSRGEDGDDDDVPAAGAFTRGPRHKWTGGFHRLDEASGSARYERTTYAWLDNALTLSGHGQTWLTCDGCGGTCAAGRLPLNLDALGHGVEGWKPGRTLIRLVTAGNSVALGTTGEAKRTKLWGIDRRGRTENDAMLEVLPLLAADHVLAREFVTRLAGDDTGVVHEFLCHARLRARPDTVHDTECETPDAFVVADRMRVAFEAKAPGVKAYAKGEQEQAAVRLAHAYEHCRGYVSKALLVVLADCNSEGLAERVREQAAGKIAKTRKKSKTNATRRQVPLFGADNARSAPEGLLYVGWDRFLDHLADVAKADPIAAAVATTFQRRLLKP